MKPISYERAEWLKERLKVVNRCIELAKTNMYTLRGGGVQRDELQEVLLTFNTERTSIELELRVLKEFVVGP
jgi:hypothetical protein